MERDIKVIINHSHSFQSEICQISVSILSDCSIPYSKNLITNTYYYWGCEFSGGCNKVCFIQLYWFLLHSLDYGWHCNYSCIAYRYGNRNTVWWCIEQYNPLLWTCYMVSTYSPAARRNQNQCSLGSFGLVIKLRDCDIGLERDSSPVEREKNEKRENPTLHLKSSENRYAYECSNYF